MIEVDDSDTKHISVFNLALVRERDGRTSEAIEGFRKSISMEPGWAQGHLYLARCLRDSGDGDAAIEPLTKYLEIEPEDIDEWISLAIIHSNAGRYKSADLAYKRASAIDATSVSLNFNRGITSRRAEHREQLEECVELLAKEAADDWRTALLRGYLHEFDGQLWQAWESFSEAADPELFESEDEEAKECAAAHALAFVVEHDMNDQATELASRCYESFVLSYDVLYQLRRMESRHAIEAFDFGVLIKSDLTDEAAIEQLRADDALGPPYSFFRNYRIIADSAEVAGRIALEFEGRVGGKNIEIEEITEVEPVQDVFLGVWWLARELHCFSKNGQGSDE